MEAKFSPRLPSRLHSQYKFSVEMRPLFPVPYFTLKKVFYIEKTSIAESYRGYLNVQLAVIVVYILLHSYWLVIWYILIHLKCPLDSSQLAEFKNQYLACRLTFLRLIPLAGFAGEISSDHARRLEEQRQLSNKRNDKLDPRSQIPDPSSGGRLKADNNLSATRWS